MAKSWEEKFNNGKEPVIKRIDKKFADIPMGADMLIASPKVIADYLKQIPEGYGTDIKKIRTDLANEFGAQYTCPVTTAIFLRTVSEYAHEQLQKGASEKDIPPFWRAIDPKSKILGKLTFGKEFVLKKRKAEGLAA